MNAEEIAFALFQAQAIPGYRGYLITTNGIVISKRRKNAIELKQAWNNHYFAVGLVNDDGKQIMKYIHDLVLTTFVGPRPSPTHECRHLDGDSTNNALSNLAWGTRRENAQDRIRHGTQRNPAGEESPTHKLTNEEVLTIAQRADAGEDQYEIAKEYGVTQSLVSAIKLGKRWRTVTGRQAA